MCLRSPKRAQDVCRFLRENHGREMCEGTPLSPERASKKTVPCSKLKADFLPEE
jgi:hypothetical protein